MSFAGIPQECGYYEFARVEEIRGRPADRVGKALWTESEKGLFITCARCGVINSLEGFDVVEEAIVGLSKSALRDVIDPCIHCVKCNAVFGVHLLDWEKVSKATRNKFAKKLRFWRKKEAR